MYTWSSSPKEKKQRKKEEEGIIEICIDPGVPVVRLYLHMYLPSRLAPLPYTRHICFYIIVAARSSWRLTFCTVSSGHTVDTVECENPKKRMMWKKKKSCALIECFFLSWKPRHRGSSQETRRVSPSSLRPRSFPARQPQLMELSKEA